MPINSESLSGSIYPGGRGGTETHAQVLQDFSSIHLIEHVSIDCSTIHGAALCTDPFLIGLPLRLGLCIVFIDQSADQTTTQHPVPVDPGVHLGKHLIATSPGALEQLRFTTRMKPQVCRDIVHFSRIAGPRVFALAARMSGQLTWRNTR